MRVCEPFAFLAELERAVGSGSAPLAVPPAEPGSSVAPDVDIFFAGKGLGAGCATCACTQGSQAAPRSDTLGSSGSFTTPAFIPGTSGNIFYVTVPSAGPSVCLPLTSHPLPLTPFGRVVQFQPCLAGSWKAQRCCFPANRQLGRGERPWSVPRTGSRSSAELLRNRQGRRSALVPA